MSDGLSLKLDFSISKFLVGAKEIKGAVSCFLFLIFLHSLQEIGPQQGQGLRNSLEVQFFLGFSALTSQAQVQFLVWVLKSSKSHCMAKTKPKAKQKTTKKTK